MRTSKKIGTKSVKKVRTKKDIIAYRRSCKLSGTGLTHYILMARKRK